MKFAIHSDHIQYFKENKRLMLQDLFTAEQRAHIKEGIDEAFTHRLGEGWQKEPTEELFVSGFNLHCDSAKLRRQAMHRSFGEAFAELFYCRPLRLGYDLYLPANKQTPDNPYGEFLRSAGTLQNMCCVQGVLGGLLLCIEPPDRPDPQNIFPSSPEQVSVFRADKILPFSYLNELKTGAFYMITFTEAIALYVHNESDPHLHALKRWGYSFGDKLREPHYPIIVR